MDATLPNCDSDPVIGAGKSTLLNALLRESCLLPTNCMRACTATMIELVFNASPEPGLPYVAEIEMVPSDSWRQEVWL